MRSATAIAAKEAVAASSERVVTLVLHGTFARDATWWRPGNGGEATFADRLEDALHARGAPGSVWQPVIEAGVDPSTFSWSGENSHRARLRAAADLAAKLDSLADHAGATSDAPLAVNIVAHSHGGNVALESLCRLNERVRIRRLVMLGTPLIARRPELRLVRVLFGSSLLAIIAIFMCMSLLAVAAVPFAPRSGDDAATGILTLTGVAIWAFGLAVLVPRSGTVCFWLLDHLWRFLLHPVRMLLGRTAGQAYGPPPATLRRLMDGSPVILFTSHQDEADLLLQLGAAPRRLYANWVQRQHFLVGTAEWWLLRPLLDSVVFELLEIVLERYVLGFGWVSLLFDNCKKGRAELERAYPPSVVRRVDVTEHLLPLLRKRAQGLPPPLPVIERASLPDEQRRAQDLQEVLTTVVASLKDQLTLRHSLYYECDAVIESVAAELV